MGEALGCRIPEDLYYNVEKHIWARLESDGTVSVGMTDVAQSLAGKIIVVSPKPAGRRVEKNKSAGTLESGKWVGMVPSPVGGEIVASNDAVKKTPTLVNEDPYGAGWIVRVKPDNWEADSADLVTGAAAVDAYQARMQRDGLKCAG